MYILSYFYYGNLYSHKYNTIKELLTEGLEDLNQSICREFKSLYEAIDATDSALDTNKINFRILVYKEKRKELWCLLIEDIQRLAEEENALSEYLDEYLEDPWFCPKCHSGNIDAVEPDEHPIVENGEVWQDIKCNKCGFEWKDIYKLKSIEAINGN